jgi:hypothetical protein
MQKNENRQHHKVNAYNVLGFASSGEQRRMVSKVCCAQYQKPSVPIIKADGLPSFIGLPGYHKWSPKLPPDWNKGLSFLYGHWLKGWDVYSLLSQNARHGVGHF